MSDQPLGYRLMLSLGLPMACLTSTEAHRSGCHHWHSCPSDHGTYTYGDLGYCMRTSHGHRKRYLSLNVRIMYRFSVLERKGSIMATDSKDIQYVISRNQIKVGASHGTGQDANLIAIIYLDPIDIEEMRRAIADYDAEVQR